MFVRGLTEVEARCPGDALAAARKGLLAAAVAATSMSRCNTWDTRVWTMVVEKMVCQGAECDFLGCPHAAPRAGPSPANAVEHVAMGMHGARGEGLGAEGFGGGDVGRGAGAGGAGQGASSPVSCTCSKPRVGRMWRSHFHVVDLCSISRRQRTAALQERAFAVRSPTSFVNVMLALVERRNGCVSVHAF